MKIIVVGASGTIGKPVADELAKNHEVLRASKSKSEHEVDISSRASIEAFFKKTGPFDALVCAAGGGHIGSFSKMTEEDFLKGIHRKLMGQVNLVLYGQHHIKDGGSFTLTSGNLAESPVLKSANLATANAAVNGFGLAAARELLQRGVRVNVISPALLQASVSETGHLFPGQETVSTERVVKAYIKSVEGGATGQVYRVG